jgi:hypothetical protein
MAVHSSMAALFTSFGYGLLVFLTSSFVEYGKKNSVAYIFAKLKVFV